MEGSRTHQQDKGRADSLWIALRIDAAEKMQRSTEIVECVTSDHLVRFGPPLTHRDICGSCDTIQLQNLRLRWVVMAIGR